MPVEIQQVETDVERDPRRYLTMLLAEAGLGKTTWLAQIPGIYILAAEPGTEGVKFFGHNVLNWQEFLDSCKTIIRQREAGWKDEKGNPVRPIEVIGIDTYDRLLEHVAQWVIANETFKIEGKDVKFMKVDEVPFGMGYRRASELLIATLLKLKGIGFGVFLACHVKERVIKQLGQELTYYGPKCTPMAAELIIEACGCIGFFGQDFTYVRNADQSTTAVEKERWAKFQPQSAQITAKHRLKGFPAKIVLRRDTMWMDYCAIFEQTYKTEVLGERANETAGTDAQVKS